MNAVFLDTIGLIAVWDASDQWHTAADAAYQALLQQERRLVTTPPIEPVVVDWAKAMALNDSTNKLTKNSFTVFDIQGNSLNK